MDVTRLAEVAFFPPVALIVALFLIVGVVVSVSRAKASPALRVQRALFFSPAERAFLGALDGALGGDYRVFGKVRVSDVLEPQPGPLGARTRRLLRDRVDYVVCRASDLSVLCAINLEAEPRGLVVQKRRARLEAAFGAADLPLLWLPERGSYARQSVEALLAPVFSNGTPARIDKRSKPGPRTLETHLN